jgi:hypothetical protein
VDNVFRFFLIPFHYLHSSENSIMVRPIPKERELAIIDLLQYGSSYSKVKSRFPGTGSSTITRTRKKYLLLENRPSEGRPQTVSEPT